MIKVLDILIFSKSMGTSAFSSLFFYLTNDGVQLTVSCQQALSIVQICGVVNSNGRALPRLTL